MADTDRPSRYGPDRTLLNSRPTYAPLSRRRARLSFGRPLPRGVPPVSAQAPTASSARAHLFICCVYRVYLCSGATLSSWPHSYEQRVSRAGNGRRASTACSDVRQQWCIAALHQPQRGMAADRPKPDRHPGLRQRHRPHHRHRHRPSRRNRQYRLPRHYRRRQSGSRPTPPAQSRAVTFAPLTDTLPVFSANAGTAPSRRSASGPSA